MIIKVDKPRFRSKIACFDYDWTLVCPKDGKVYPKDLDDWQWLRSGVPDIVREYYNNGYGIYIFTNQSKLWKKDQIIAVIESLKIPVTICIAYDKLSYKPSLDIYNEAFSNDLQKKIKKTQSFMCGDALGRPNDHSDSDLKFAQAIGVKILSPEEMFPVSPIIIKEHIVSPKNTQEVVIMVGYPGSGKSTICDTIFKPAGYYIAHGDILKTSIKMIKEAKKYVQDGKSVVFDATNPTKEKRSEYVKFANEFGLPVRCILMTTSLEDSLARNNMRDKPVSRIVYNIYKKKYEEPSIDEGFIVVRV